MWGLGKGSGSVSPSSTSTPSVGLFRFMPFGTSPAVSRAGDFDGRVRKTFKHLTSPWIPPCTDDDGLNDETFPDNFDPDEPVEVFVGGLRELGDSINEDELRKHFEQFGDVLKLELTRDRRRHDQRGFCFVTFTRKASAIACLEHKEHSIRGMSIAVERAMRESSIAKSAAKKRTRRSRRPGRLQSFVSNADNASVPFTPAQSEPKHFFSRAPMSSTPSQQSRSSNSTPSRPGLQLQFNVNCATPTCVDPGYIYVATQPSTPVTSSHQPWNFSMGGSTRDLKVSADMPGGSRSFSHRSWAVGKESMIHQLYSGWRNSYTRNQDQHLYQVSGHTYTQHP